MLSVADPVVRVADATFRRARPILDGFSLDLEPGRTTAMVGPSGCGKTTLLRLIAGLERLERGRIDLNVGGAGSPMAYMLQDHDAFPWLTVRQNIELSGQTDSDRLEDAAHRLGLADLLDRYPRQLSGGQRKRVALARCLLADPALLIMDEPFGSLDVRAKFEIFNLMETTFADPRRAALLVTHSVEEAVVLSDRLLVLSGPPLAIVADIAIPAERPRGRAFVESDLFKSREADVLKLMLGGGDGRAG